MTENPDKKIDTMDIVHNIDVILTVHRR